MLESIYFMLFMTDDCLIISKLWVNTYDILLRSDKMALLDAFVEGDQIHVIAASGHADTGVFLRIETDFLIWVKNNEGAAVYAFTSLEGISIFKL